MIRIVLIKKLMFVMFFVLIFPVIAHTSDINLHWDANTETDMAGYTVHYGTESEVYTDNIPVGNITDYILSLNAGIYYIVITAEDLSGNVSDYSYEIKLTVKLSIVTGFRKG